MALWKNTDTTDGKPKYLSTADKARTYGVDTNEAAAEAAQGTPVTHAGWVLRTVGSGGRSGRVFNETLVAMGSMTGDAEDTVMQDAFITITTEPAATATAVAGAAIATLASVTATVVPTSATITYQWQQSVNGGVSYSNINPAGGVFTGATSASLGVNAGMTDTTSTWNNAKFRCVLSVTGGDSKTSTATTLTVTAAP